MQEKILIIDFGSQVTQLIARRLREEKVYCEIHPFFRITEEFLRDYSPKGIILSGGPASVIEEGSPQVSSAIFSANVPILGICYGQQGIVHTLGGTVEKGRVREFGHATISIVKDAPIFKDLWTMGQDYSVWMSHGDKVTAIPEEFEILALSHGAPFAIIGNLQKHIYGVQFHPEVAHTPNGAILLRNFCRNVCNIKNDWTMDAFKDQAIQDIRTKVGSEGHVICGLSGGVDSSVTAILVHKAIAGRLTCVFVDTGLMRHNEAECVVNMFRDNFKIPLVHVDAKEKFLTALKGVVDPEQKRKIIGKLFIEVFDEEAAKIKNAEFLAQGTLYPDVIESVSVVDGMETTIKSHHNVGGLPKDLKFKLIEPLRTLFKDEVRELGRELGIDNVFISRHPFPGPGLAVRIIGDITPEKVEVLQRADDIYIRMLREENLYNQIWQAFAVLTNVKSVGVMGDARSYDYVLALRAVTSVDGMTADIYHFNTDFLSRVATKIINEVRGISRVVYDLTQKPPATIEWE